MKQPEWPLLLFREAAVSVAVHQDKDGKYTVQLHATQHP
jgi:hypothetical protein